MLKRTLFFSSAVSLRLQLSQLAIHFVEEDRPNQTIPLEDIGIIILEHRQIQLTHPLLSACMEHKITVVCCDAKHMPSGVMLPFRGHSEMQQRQRWQLQAKEPLRKQLWRQLVVQKIRNQAAVLEQVGRDGRPLLAMIESVQSGDKTNVEGHAAALYWREVFADFYPKFVRDRDLAMVNPILNYGYAVVRAAAARAVVSAGLLVSYGLFHKNKYNAYALADDLMEPFRPYMDRLCYDLILEHGEVEIEEVTLSMKQQIWQLMGSEVQIDGSHSVFQIAMQRSAVSLAHCFAGTQRKLNLPNL
ncbi:type II CRISPR-associated endonuclease Cas1 [Halosquirtibacter laminarini]|uniref:Type II CRISPR-associated endonuclease Cas1 n=1 Tax=Halosquirtibacter laminarini TaxID=3374600 RepID=A0AC61NIQ8_9BACT|nr:type II CRISPR-associated endonuclease Cas1 [Prolixibacteraceae bacterium]